MTTKWLVRYSEIFLKSDPVRRHWERVLINNIREQQPGVKIRSERGRIWLTGTVDPVKLQHVFGIVSFSPVEHVARDAALEDAVIEYGRAHGLAAAKTFALRIRRVGRHDFSSNDKAIELGDVVRRAFPHLKVNLATPEVEIHVEIRQDECYLYDTVIKGAGGLPLGVEGTLVALVSGGIDSPVAAYMMMKRGCTIVPVFVALDTFLDETVLARAERVVEILRQYQPDIALRVIPDSYLAAAKKELVKNHQEKYTCLFCKRRMYRIAQAVAGEVGAKGIVTGESLGQVASQTLDNLVVLSDAATIPVYRPLIGFDKADAITIAREIGTYEESVSKTTGCRAVPKGPSTKARLAEIREIEQQMESATMSLPV
ncbi:tRNA uracil 4-sulfurtransferase ThiI [Methanoregula sp.]|uniref:tRNA uracil 4-sulfurtransferase ThiI n=1 Tax=Methanoregula sp. TaxID=2052170 RepID=UPI002BFEF510|nr:tRNA uracil 4-sulfurtransferase ThiI [Methanoregula sp.]HVP97006.1 tRNA uracil 4-sulfurtransferase ThiI [Methanoregula sp.]